MNSYLIQKSILTSIPIYDSDLKYGGYTIKMFGDYNDHKGLMIEKTVTAKNIHEAYQLFISELLPTLNRISVLTQCSIEPLGKSSALIYRQNNNPDKNIFFYFGQKIPTVGLDLGQNNINDLEKLKGTELDIVFDLLRESNYATTPKLQLALLISAAEALAGEISNPRKLCECGKEVSTSYMSLDKEKMKTILSPELYKEIYNQTRIRQRLFHGKQVTDEEAGAISSKLYQRLLVGYLKPTFRLESLREEAKAVPRNDGAFEYGGAYIRLGSDREINFDEIEQQFDSPKDIEVIDTIPDY